ncbi:hypothetical protein B0T25DRAFT_605664 [Lasiosphaeria hispida]|uniref:Heterokaryon incompatibility domain-containing protein n=1 Tax=Lasiosphaeria hispida TaxID=260671 RepID=A0AAJ0MGX7_9PEZI|nr:hypothetical protein B0T25DRAFT_605664 [Lasiosphaeria hispida]
MATVLPTRLLRRIDDDFSVFSPELSPQRGSINFDIVSYRWGTPVAKYFCERFCGITGVEWEVTIPQEKLNDIKRLMRTATIEYMWADCVCIKSGDASDAPVEIAKMYDYYREAERCHILLDMERAWRPQQIVKDLKVVDHVIVSMSAAAIVTESISLTHDVVTKLAEWADETEKPWVFPLPRETVASAAVDAGLLNCYATCINHIASLFDNEYFSRVWTFQEILLGKQIRMWSVNPSTLESIGSLEDWINLATDAKDKAEKLQRWIEASRVHKTDAVLAVLAVIEVHKLYLEGLQTRVRGIHSARIDIITGGPSWWMHNHGGVSNIFSAISIKSRECVKQQDVFRGLLGIFNGLFDAKEIEQYMKGDMNVMTFQFFRRLSKRTKRAWTPLVLSSKRQQEPGWDWIPVVAADGRSTTDCFAGVANLGMLDESGGGALVVANATMASWVYPRDYVDIKVTRVGRRDGGDRDGGRGIRFEFTGCNCGMSIGTRSRFGSSTNIPVSEQWEDVTTDETGRALVRCGTILGHLLDPDQEIGQYRGRLFRNLQPVWNTTDTNAKPPDWVNRCVSGTYLATASHFRVHNESVRYNMAAITKCKSRLHNPATANLECEMKVKCGCVVTAPYSMLFEAITAVQGSSLGATSASLDGDGRITLTDGLGLIQVEDLDEGREQKFRLIAFEGEADAHRKHARRCMSTPSGMPVDKNLQWPKGRVLVDGGFNHGPMATLLGGYGYVRTGGAGNLLLCRSNPLHYYRLMGGA